MPRQPRLDFPGVPLHVLHQAGTGLALFHDDADARYYVDQLRLASGRSGCMVHAYGLARNAARLLVTGQAPGAVSRMVGQVGRSYARYAQMRYRDANTARWTGRYLSCPVGGRREVLLALACVEGSAQVSPRGDAAALWSSQACHTEGVQDSLLASHPAYLALAGDPLVRRNRYRGLALAAGEVDEVLLMHTRQGRPWGSRAFLDRVAAVLGSYQPARPRGRPRKRQAALSFGAALILSPFFLTVASAFVETMWRSPLVTP